MTPQGMIDGCVELAVFAELVYFCPIHSYYTCMPLEGGECYASNAKMNDILVHIVGTWVILASQ